MTAAATTPRPGEAGLGWPDPRPRDSTGLGWPGEPGEPAEQARPDEEGA